MAPPGTPGCPGTPGLAGLSLRTSLPASGHLSPGWGPGRGQRKVGFAALGTPAAGPLPLQVASGSVLAPSPGLHLIPERPAPLLSSESSGRTQQPPGSIPWPSSVFAGQSRWSWGVKKSGLFSFGGSCVVLLCPSPIQEAGFSPADSTSRNQGPNVWSVNEQCPGQSFSLLLRGHCWSWRS